MGTLLQSVPAFRLAGSRARNTIRRPLSLNGNEYQGDGVYAPRGSFVIPRSATNQVTNSDAVTDDTGTSWNGAGVTSGRDTTKSPFGLPTSFQIVTPGSGVGEGLAWLSSAGIAAPGDVWSAGGAVYHEAGVAVQMVCRISWRNSGGSAISEVDGPTVSVPSGVPTWLPCVAQTAPALTDSIRTKIVTVETKAMAFWAGRVVTTKTAYMVPPIQTNGAAAARNAGLVNGITTGMSVVQGNGACLWSPPMGTPQGTNFGRIMSLSNNGSYPIDQLYVALTGTASANLGLYVTRTRSADGSGLNPNIGFELTAGTQYLIWWYWTATALGLSVNGSPFYTVANQLFPSGLPANFGLGSEPTGAAGAGGAYAWAFWGTGTPNNAQAAAAQQLWRNAKPQWSQVPTAIGLRSLWDGRNNTYEVAA